jgi:biotin carboxylase
MRRVDAAGDFKDALDSCKREAASSFGDDRVILEKYILSPRHIEVQEHIPTATSFICSSATAPSSAATRK